MNIQELNRAKSKILGVAALLQMLHNELVEVTTLDLSNKQELFGFDCCRAVDKLGDVMDLVEKVSNVLDARITLGNEPILKKSLIAMFEVSN